MQPISEFFPQLQQPAQVVITMHQKPDGDALGSSLGLYHFLVKMGHTVTVISPTNWPDFLTWLPGMKQVINYENQREKCRDLLAASQVIFCLDFNILHRTKSLEPLLEQASAIKILIDHHQEPQEEAFQFGVSDTTKSSTCEMVYDFIVQSGNDALLDADIATCLYTGVMTDTGSFRFPSTSASVHRMVARLKDTGMSHAQIHEEIYDNFLENRLRFIGFALLNRMELFYEYNTFKSYYQIKFIFFNIIYKTIYLLHRNNMILNHNYRNSISHNTPHVLYKFLHTGMYQDLQYHHLLNQRLF